MYALCVYEQGVYVPCVAAVCVYVLVHFDLWTRLRFCHRNVFPMILLLCTLLMLIYLVYWLCASFFNRMHGLNSQSDL